MSKLTISNLAGTKLKALRLSQGYKIHDMATKLKKSDQQLFRYERGVNKMDLDTIINYLDVLNIDISMFFSELYLEIEVLKENSDVHLNLPEPQNTKKLDFQFL